MFSGTLKEFSNLQSAIISEKLKGKQGWKRTDSSKYTCPTALRKRLKGVKIPRVQMKMIIKEFGYIYPENRRVRRRHPHYNDPLLSGSSDSELDCESDSDTHTSGSDSDTHTSGSD